MYKKNKNDDDEKKIEKHYTYAKKLKHVDTNTIKNQYRYGRNENDDDTRTI